MILRTLVLLLMLPAAALAADVKLPLPAAPVRVVIPDAAAFDAALGGAYQNAFLGTPKAGDPLVNAWRQSPLGTKLDDQWTLFAGDLPWTWQDIRKLRPRAVGVALLAIGHMEAVVVIDTPLAILPVQPPVGTNKSHGGVSYTLVTPGAADDDDRTERRPGLAWARTGERVFIATSERALLLTLDQALAGRGMTAPLPGLVSMELDLDVLRRDRYFRREFVFPAGPETGILRAALRIEDGRMTEVREGTGESRATGFLFEAPRAAAAGWEPDGRSFWRALRAGLLEPIAVLTETPVASLQPLPPASREAAEDRYAVNITRPMAVPSARAWEAGDLARWKALFETQAVASWGYWLGADGVRRLVFPWPAARDQALLELCRTTIARRAGRATLSGTGDVHEIRVGPGLTALAVKRTGDFLWVGSTAGDLAAVPVPRAADLVRWARIDVTAVRGESRRWVQVEGPFRPEYVRPLSDRVLGLMDWMPATTSISVERRRTETGWSERVVFGVAGPAAR